MNLNLGCRNNLLPGYINIDLYKPNFPILEGEYLQANVLSLDEYFRAESVDLIRSEYLFEHLSHQEITILLYKLWMILKPGGTLITIVPDFFETIKVWKEKQQQGTFSDADILHVKVFDTAEETLHKSVWYEEMGRYYLTREGFFEIIGIEHPSPVDIQFRARKIK